MAITPAGWNSPEFPPPPEMEGDDILVLLATGDERRGCHCRHSDGSDAGWMYESTIADNTEAEIVGWKPWVADPPQWELPQ